MLSVLSTLPHYVSIIPLYPHDMYEYKTAIIVSSTISVVWHLYGEPQNIILGLDYVAACYWAFCELQYGQDNETVKIFLLNILVLLLNRGVEFTDNYALYHSMWHLVSAAKCFYIATIISQSRTLRLTGSPYPSDSYQRQALNTHSPSSQRSSSFPPWKSDP